MQTLPRRRSKYHGLRVSLAYLTVVLIWSTTPLAIKWSGEGPGYLFGVSARMALGWLVVLAWLAISGGSLPWNRKALANYLAVAGHVYASLLAVYWAAQFVPSGWVAVIFGLTPMLTALLAALAGEWIIALLPFLAYLLGLAGLAVIFVSATGFSELARLGIAGTFVGALLQAASTVAVKRIDSGLPALSQVAGGLTLAVPAYLLTWAALDGHWPAALPTASLLSIIYLAVIATPFGFACYFFVLKHLAATRVVLITLITPVVGLLIGIWLNGEPLKARILLGTGLILSAVLIHEFRWIRDRAWARR